MVPKMTRIPGSEGAPNCDAEPADEDIYLSCTSSSQERPEHMMYTC